MANSEIQKLVDTFVSHLEAEIRSAALVAVQAALSGVSAKAAASPKAPAKLVVKAAAKPAVKPAAAKPSVAKPAAKPAGAAVAKPAAAKPAAAKPSVRVRRSPADIDRDVGRLTGYVRANQGITSEKARAVLQFDKTIWTQTLRRAVETQQLSTKGEKRNTTLHVPGPTPPVRR